MPRGKSNLISEETLNNKAKEVIDFLSSIEMLKDDLADEKSRLKKAIKEYKELKDKHDVGQATL